MLQAIDSNLYKDLLQEAYKNPRKRSHHNLHKSFEDPVQRVLIGLTEGTYVRPHMHPQPHKWEMALALKGRFTMLFFTSEGKVTHRHELAPDSDLSGLDVPSGTWHTLFPNTADAVIMEIKEGPFKPDDIAHFADWAPDEKADDTDKFLQWAMSAQVNDVFR